MQSTFIDLILDEKKKGKTILLSSHIFEEVERTCDRAAIIREGRLAAVEDIDKLRQNKRKIVELQFPSADTARDFASRMPSARQNGESVTVKVKGNMDALVKLASEYPVADLDIKTQSLEEIFMHFYGGKEDD